MDNMQNPYTSMYMPTGFDQNQQGLTPVFQNIASQQANQNAALQQQNQLVQQAGITQKGQQLGGDPNQVAMAKALRNQNGVSPMQNGQTYINSKFGRDPMQPDMGQGANTAQQFYGDSYNPNAGWSM
jgi:hypothetical protein